MSYLLDFVYVLALVVFSPYLVFQAIRKGKYREGFAAKFLGRVPQRDPARPCLWLHAVSVGEVNLLAPLLREIARQRPDWECVLSTTTITGMALARKKYAGHTVFYCPLDFSWAVRAALRRVRPTVLVLAELELWPNLVRAAREHGARVAVINGRLSEHSFAGYRRIRPFVARLLRQIDVIAAQDATYAARFEALGAPRTSIVVTGSMKYDGAQTDRGNPATSRLRELAGIGSNDVVFLAGSTQAPEEALALAAWRELAPRWPQLRLIIVPRHPERFEEVTRLLNASGLPWQRRTALEQFLPSPLAGEGSRMTQSLSSPQPNFGRCTEDGLGVRQSLPSPLAGDGLGVRGPCRQETPLHSSESRILLVDVVGELGAWWGMTNIAFVGGSLSNRGGQNMIEPAAYGAAVSFGPNTRNFRDIVATMLARDAAVVVPDGPALTRFVEHCLQEPAYAAQLGARAKTLVAEQLGATTRTFDLLDALVAAGLATQESRRAA